MAHISSTIAKKALARVQDAMHDADSIREAHLSRCMDWLKLYYNDRNSLKKDWHSKIRVPIAYTTIETELPRIQQGVFGHPKWVVAVPREQNDEAGAKLATTLLDWQLNSRIDSFLLSEDHFRQCLQLGTAVTMVPWRRKTRKVRKATNYNPLLKMLAKLKGIASLPNSQTDEVVEFEGPTLEPVSLFDMWLDPAGNIADGYAYFVRHFTMTETQLRAEQEAGTYQDVEAGIKGAPGDQYSSETESHRGELLDLNDLSDTDSVDRVVKRKHLYEYWGPFDAGPGEMEHHITILGNSVIGFEEFPYDHGMKPFIVSQYIRQTSSPYGIGKIQPIESLIEALNSVRNQRMDNVKMVLNVMWKVINGRGVNPMDLVSRPGGTIVVSNMGDVEPITFPDIRSSGYEEETILRENIDSTNGQYDYTRGNMEGVNKTATGVQTIVNEGNVRFRATIKRFQRSYVVPVGRHFLGLDRQFLESDVVVRVTGEGSDEYTWQTIRPQDIASEYDFIPQGTFETSDPDAKRASIMELAQILLSSPAFASVIKTDDLARVMVDAYEMPELRKLILSPLDIAKAQAAADMQKSAQQIAARKLMEQGMPQDEAMSVLAQGDMETMMQDEKGGGQ